MTDNINDYKNIKNIILSDENKKYVYHISLNNDDEKLSDFFISNSPNNYLLENDVFNELSIFFSDNRIKKITYDLKKQIRLLIKFNINFNLLINFVSVLFVWIKYINFDIYFYVFICEINMKVLQN